MTKELVMEYLKKEFGIKNEQELMKAFAKTKKVNIGIMTTGGKEEEEDDRITGFKRADVQRK